MAQDEKRGKNSKKELALTQGKLYNFQQGHVFYDDMAAYNDIWSDALKKINLCLQIDSATESVDVRPIVVREDNRFVRRQKLSYGSVDFSVYKPNAERTQLEKVKTFSCSQEQFVSLLRTGEFEDVNSELQTL
ncbi:MAG: hypothetical protein SR1Q5_08965 [Quinella sp. 1Q5]|nr:hypothetical protein [Quinella sp. 1Q5]